MPSGMHLSLTTILPDFSLIPLPFFYVAAGIFGGVIGSFLNVVIHRLPRDQSIVFPNSRCPSCETPIAFYDNVPVLSYLLLGGKCRSCKVHISARYPAVEALTALLWVAVAWRDGLTFALPFDLIFVTAIVALVFIDAEHMILPNAITYPGIVFAVIARLAIPYLLGGPYFDDVLGLKQVTGWSDSGASLLGALIGALVGGGSLWLMGEAWKRLRHIDAMGFGDVKMLFMVGAYLGWRLTILTIFLGALSGSVIGIANTLYEGRRDLKSQLPFGVYLGIGAIVSLFFGSQIINWYAGFYR
jgi:leader peptidase (prepilin peptidase)/N-methyltransferase